jgi:hypothetical protein
MKTVIQNLDLTVQNFIRYQLVAYHDFHSVCFRNAFHVTNDIYRFKIDPFPFICMCVCVTLQNVDWRKVHYKLWSTWAVCKVRGLTLLLLVGTLWRCGDGLFFEVPPLANDALLTTPHPLLENVLQTFDHFEISGWKSPEIAWGEIWIEFCGRLGKVDQWNPIRTSAIQFRSRPMRFLGFSNHEKGAPRQEISKWSTVCSTF